MWQHVIVGACVLAALLFVVRQYWPSTPGDKKTGGCGGCRGCGKKTGTDGCSPR